MHSLKNNLKLECVMVLENINHGKTVAQLGLIKGGWQ